MKRFLALLATGALALGLSSNANAQTRGFAAGAIVLDDLQTPQHKVVLTAPVAATPAWNAWQTAGFPTLSWSVPVPPVSGAQSGFIYTGPLTSAPAYPGTMHRLPYWLYPNQASTLPADHSANGGPAGTWDYATSDELGLVSAVGGTLNYVSKFTPNGTTLGNSALFEDATNFQIMSTPGGATPEVTVTLANGNITTLGGLTAGTTGQFTVDGATGNTSTSGTLNNNGNVALAKTAGSTTQIGNVAGFGNVTIGNGGAAGGSISLTSGTAGSLNLTGPTNINTTGTAATSIGTNGGNTSIGAAASTNTITGTTGVTGNTSINTSGTGTTLIGNGTNTLTMLGNATLNSTGSGQTTIGNGTVATTINGTVAINKNNNANTDINTALSNGAVSIGSSFSSAINITGPLHMNNGGSLSTDINSAGNTGTVTIGNASAGNVAIASGATISATGTTSVTGATTINTSGNLATTIGTAGAGASTTTINVGTGSGNLVVTGLATDLTPTQWVTLNASNQAKVTPLTGTASNGVMWNGTDGQYELANANNVSLFATDRFINTGSKILNITAGSPGATTLASLNGSTNAVTINATSGATSVGTGSGNTTVGNGTGATSITGSNWSIATTGNALSNGTLDFEGTGTFGPTNAVVLGTSTSNEISATDGTLNTPSSLNVNSGKFTVNATNGNTVAAGGLDVTGTATFGTDTQPTSVRATGFNGGSWTGFGAFGGALNTVVFGQTSGLAVIGAHDGTLSTWTDLYVNAGGGNVRVGSTTAPTSKLDVTGSFANTGNANIASAAASTTNIGNVVGFGDVTIGNIGAGTGNITLNSSVTGNIVMNGVDADNATTSLLSLDGSNNVRTHALSSLITGSNGVDVTVTSGVADAHFAPDATTSAFTSNRFINTTAAGNLTLTYGAGTTAGSLNGTSGQWTFATNVDATNGLDVTGANLTVGGTNFSVDQSNGNTVVAGTLDAQTSIFNSTGSNGGAVGINDNLVPTTDLTRDLGSTTLRWNNAYIGPVSLHLVSKAAGPEIGYADRNFGLGVTTSGNFTIGEGASTNLLTMTNAGAVTTAQGITATNGNINAAAGALQTAGVTRIDNSGNATLQATSTTTLDVVGTANINTSGTANTTIGNATGTFAVTSPNVNITNTGMVTLGHGLAGTVQGIVRMYESPSGTLYTLAPSGGAMEINNNFRTLGTILVNNGASPDLTIAEDAMTVGGNYAINVGAANTLSTNGNFSVPGVATVGNGTTGSLVLNSAAGTNVALNEAGLDKSSAATETFAFQNSGAGVLNVSVDGQLSAGSLLLNGNLDMNNNLVLNIGNANTDFTAGGGLNLAGDLNIGAGNFTVAAATGNTVVKGTIDAQGVISNSAANVTITDATDITGATTINNTGTATTQIGNIAGFGNVTIGNNGAGTGQVNLNSGATGSVNVTGPTNVNVGTNNATNINTGANTAAYAIGNAMSTTGTILATALNLNNSGTGTTGINNVIGFGNVTIGNNGAGTGQVNVNSGATGSVNVTGPTNINASANNTTNINTGTSTSDVNLGNGSVGGGSVRMLSNTAGSVDVNNNNNSNTNINTGSSTGTVSVGNAAATLYERGAVNINTDVASKNVTIGNGAAGTGNVSINANASGTVDVEGTTTINTSTAKNTDIGNSNAGSGTVSLYAQASGKIQALGAIELNKSNNFATDINTGTSQGNVTIGNSTPAQANSVTVAVGGTGNLSLVGLASDASATAMLTLNGSNQVRTTTLSGTADQGLVYSSGKYLLGATDGVTSPFTTNRSVNLNASTLTFTAAAGVNTPLVITGGAANNSVALNSYGTGTIALAGTTSINDASGSNAATNINTTSGSGAVAIGNNATTSNTLLGAQVNVGTGTGNTAIGNTTGNVTFDGNKTITETTGAHVFSYVTSGGAATFLIPDNASVVEVTAGTTSLTTPATPVNGKILYIHNNTAGTLGGFAAIPAGQTWGFVYTGSAWQHIQ